MTSRVLAWFSCGAASAVAAKLAVEKYGERCEVLYCDTLAFEHPDNKRFMADVSAWIGKTIKLLRSQEYTDIMDVFLRTRWLVGNRGARCTTELKKVPRKEYQQPDDIQVFGFTAEEGGRIERFRAENFEVRGEFMLADAGITKADCYARLSAADIELPAMYRMGYRNNNCIGCVKGGMGYWNKIRRDFPEDFARMAGVERELGATILKDRRNGRTKRVYLDELDPTAGRYDAEPDIECGVLCSTGDEMATTAENPRAVEGDNSKKAKAGPVSADRLKSFCERIERIVEERDGLNDDIKDIFSEAKGVGYDVKTMREMLKLRAMDKADRDERESLRDTYAHALGVFA